MGSKMIETINEAIMNGTEIEVQYSIKESGAVFAKFAPTAIDVDGNEITIYSGGNLFIFAGEVTYDDFDEAYIIENSEYTVFLMA